MIPIDQAIRVTGIVLKECHSRGISISEALEYADDFLDSIKNWITEDDAHYWDDYSDQYILHEFITMHFPLIDKVEANMYSAAEDRADDEAVELQYWEDRRYSEPTDPRQQPWE